MGGKGSLEILPVKFCFFKHLPDKKNKNQNELQAIVSLVHNEVLGCIWIPKEGISLNSGGQAAFCPKFCVFLD